MSTCVSFMEINSYPSCYLRAFGVRLWLSRQFNSLVIWFVGFLDKTSYSYKGPGLRDWVACHVRLAMEVFTYFISFHWYRPRRVRRWYSHMSRESHLHQYWRIVLMWVSAWLHWHRKKLWRWAVNIASICSVLGRRYLISGHKREFCDSHREP